LFLFVKYLWYCLFEYKNARFFFRASCTYFQTSFCEDFKMKLKKLLLGAALIGTTMSAGAHLAHATDATGTATALVRAAITLVEDTGMDFGEITPNPAGDLITLTPAGGVSAVSGSLLNGTAAAGGFTSTGTALSAVTISFSTGDVLSGPGTDMALGTFTTDAGGSPAFDGAGDLNFDVGAQLTVGAAQAAGTYNGTYTISVNYQ
jgi:hypothetical protein